MESRSPFQGISLDQAPRAPEVHELEAPRGSPESRQQTKGHEPVEAHSMAIVHHQGVPLQTMVGHAYLYSNRLQELPVLSKSDWNPNRLL